MTSPVPPSAATMASVSSMVEVSFQSLAGRMTRPFPSRGTKPCCWPETPSATTFPGSTRACLQGRGQGFLRGADPDRRVLLARARPEALDHGVGGLAAAEDAPGIDVNDQRLGPLGPGIDADGVLGHFRPRSPRFYGSARRGVKRGNFEGTPFS